MKSGSGKLPTGPLSEGDRIVLFTFEEGVVREQRGILDGVETLRHALKAKRECRVISHASRRKPAGPASTRWL